MNRRVSESGANNQEHNPVKRFYEKKGRKAAINAMCAYCMGCTSVEQGNGQADHLEPGFRSEIRNCTALGCPLLMYRPFQKQERVDQVTGASK